MRVAWWSLLLAAGCSEPRVLSIDVTPGHEADAFSRDPAVTRVDVQAVGIDGSALAGASASPGGEFEMGELGNDTLVHLEVRGFEQGGETVMRGRSLSVLLGGLRGEVWPVFAQRLERWSRPPGGFVRGHAGGVGAALGERFLMLAGGSGEASRRVDFYDLLGLGGSEGPSLAIEPRSAVPSLDRSAALFVADDEATWLDFDTGESRSVELPTGLESFAEVAGGQVVVGESAAYLVGATRRDAASDRVLVVDADRTVRAGRLVVPRRGAAAGWVPDQGLIVAGGSVDEPGAERLALDSEAVVLDAAALPFSADPIEGATVVPTRGDPLLVCGTEAGNAAPIRRLDLECSADCAAEPLSLDPGPLRHDCRGFAVPGGAVVVGAREDDLLASLRLDLSGERVEVLELREPRTDAVVAPAPNGTLSVFGGIRADGTPATSVEMWFPPTE